MDIALTDQFYQKYFFDGVNSDVATNIESVRSLLGIATGAMLAAGQSLKQLKEELGQEFAGWIYSNELVTSDANRLIKLFDYFGDNFDALSEVSPFQLLRLLAPNQRASRAVLADLVDDSDSAIRCADIDSIQREHKIKSVPKIKLIPVQAPVAPIVKIEPNVNVSMVGNQQGGTGIFRLEVKDHQLANQLDNEWKESGFTANQWMRFMSSSARAVQEMAEFVLGRTITNELELHELIVAIKESKIEVACENVIANFSQIEVGGGLDELPTVVSDCLRKINDLDSEIARYTSPIGADAMTQRMYREKREKAIHKLKMLAIECELDIESLLSTI
jgi:hypothetical protein